MGPYEALRETTPKDELHPTVRACICRSFCDATFESNERRMETITDLRAQLAGAVEALRHIAESAKHPSPTVNTSAYLGQVAERALDQLGGR